MSVLQDLLSLKSRTAVTVTEDEDLSPSEASAAAEDLEGIHEEITKLMQHAQEIVRRLPRSLRGSAEAYWIPHIMIALGGEHKWMTAGHESTMQKTIDELKEEGTENSDDHDSSDTENSFGTR